MNKAAIEKFAVWARTKLISEITYKMGLLGITDKGIAEPLPQSSNDLQLFDIGTKNYAEVTCVAIKQRNALINEIKHRERTSNYNIAFASVIDEVAYTWFNRLVAVRFMEVNDYLPSHIRVLSSENSAKSEPDLVTNPFDTDLIFTPFEQDRIVQLKDENELDELFRMLFIKQCNKLHDILPELFEKTDDYSELLLTISFTDKNGVVYHLTHDISENDFNVEKEGQVEIIGWLYQFYNAEPKEQLINAKNRYKPLEISFVTQLFTPDWIVRYMVQNSLGRYWVEEQGESSLKQGWEFYLDNRDKSDNVILPASRLYKDPKEIKFIDPCMGSGHILVYAFDLLMEIYENCGYTQRDAAKSILENNLYGLDISKRAYQLTYFALMMKARGYNRRILNQNISLNVYLMKQSNDIDPTVVDYITNGDMKVKNALNSVLDCMYNADIYGSTIQKTESIDFQRLYERFEEIQNDVNIFTYSAMNDVLPLVKISETLCNQYDVVATNPPYMGEKYMPTELQAFVRDRYPISKADMFAVFIERCFAFGKSNSHIGLVTPYAWMFLDSYKSLRKRIIDEKTITSLVQLEFNAFEVAALPVCTYTIRNKRTNESGEFVKLSEFTGADNQPIKLREAISKPDVPYRFTSKTVDFEAISGYPFAYWTPESVRRVFEKGTSLGDIAIPRQGMATTDNNRFVRLWQEVNFERIGFGLGSTEEAKESVYKWFPYNKGGRYRKWYGNNDHIVDYENDGLEIKKSVLKKYSYLKTPDFVVKNQNCYFLQGITWTFISIDIGVRFSPTGALFDVAGSSLFPDENNIYYILGFMCSKLMSSFMQILNPTMNVQAGNVACLPLIISNEQKNSIENIVHRCIQLSKDEWDSFETSWDFEKHPFLKYACSKIEDAYLCWEKERKNAFEEMRSLEIDLNRRFIDVYGIGDAYEPTIREKDITLRLADKERDVKSFISYAVGCMLGRYSIDYKGLAYAGGSWDSRKYTSFTPDVDNCLPITDEEYFKDDIVGRFVEFVKLVFGKETLEENLSFIAQQLGNKGVTSREIIRTYFLNDFIEDHITMYHKRPVYWLFSSGKKNGFKALVYMHRWNADTIGNMRVEYLHRMQRVYESEIARMQETIDNSTNSREVSAAEKRKDKLTKQLKETKGYDTKIAHLALSRIDIDLDDGVKVNYEKVQTPPDGKNMGILTKIK